MARTAIRHSVSCMTHHRVTNPRLTGTILQSLFTDLAVVDEEAPVGGVYAHPSLAMLAMFLTISGRAQAIVNGQILHHRPGTIILLPGGVSLEERVGDEPWHLIYLMAKGPMPAALEKSVARMGTSALVYSPAPARMREEFSAALQAGHDQPLHWDWQFLRRLSTLVTEIVARPSPMSDNASLVDRVRMIVDAAPNTAWTTTALAKELGISVSSLCHRFTDLAGEPLAAWIRGQRIQRARRLLGQGLSVTQVSELMGFSSPYAFSRTYRMMLDVPPSRHRGQMVNSPLVRSEPQTETERV